MWDEKNASAICESKIYKILLTTGSDNTVGRQSLSDTLLHTLHSFTLLPPSGKTLVVDIKLYNTLKNKIKPPNKHLLILI